MDLIAFGLENMYMPLYAASENSGATYDVVSEWFHRCGIIDGRFITEEHFIRAFERLCPNREPLSLAQFVQLVGILARDTRRGVQEFVDKFQLVRQTLVEELVEARRNDDYRYS